MCSCWCTQTAFTVFFQPGRLTFALGEVLETRMLFVHLVVVVLFVVVFVVVVVVVDVVVVA